MKIILGSAGKTQDGWISTDKDTLDVCNPDNFPVEVDAMLAEHLFEHVCPVLPALRNCYNHLKVDGYLRLAVPDGYHPNKDYIEYVSPPSMGHCVLYNFHSMSDLLAQAGFRVELLEWWDEHGVFHAKPWNEIDGYIERCLANDPRNNDGKPHYTSLVIDAKKTIDPRLGLQKAFEFIHANDSRGLSEYNRRKATVFYELARLAPKRGVIIEMGSYHGFGTVPIWYGAKDGNRGRVIAMDSYTERYGWIGEPYGPEDEYVWHKNMEIAGINPELIKGECVELGEKCRYPVSMMMFDLGHKRNLLDGVMTWEKHFVMGGLLGIRDIDDFSNGTEPAIFALLSTGRWGKRIDWPAFHTSVERIA